MELAPAGTLARVVIYEQARVADYFCSLDAARWSSPSACEGWSQAHVAAHLTGSTVTFLVDALTRALDGQPPTPPTGWPADPEERRAALEGLVARRGADMGAAFGEAARRAEAVLERVEDRHATLPAWHPNPRYVSTVQHLLYARLFELSLHTWDVGSTHDDARLPERTLPYLVDWTRVRAWHFLPTERIPDGPSGAVRFYLRDSPQGSFILAVTPGGSGLADAAVEPEATIDTDAETFVLVLTGRRAARTARLQGLWKTTGQARLIQAVEQGVAPF